MPRSIDEKNGLATSTMTNPIAPVLRADLAQMARPVVGSVPERRDGLLHPADEIRTDAAFVVDHPGHRLEADAGLFGDVTHRRSPMLRAGHRAPMVVAWPPDRGRRDLPSMAASLDES